MAYTKGLTWAQVNTALSDPANAGKIFTRAGWAYNKRGIYYVGSVERASETLTAQTVIGTTTLHAPQIELVDDDNKNDDDMNIVVVWKPNPADTSPKDWVMLDATDFRSLPNPL